MLVGIVALSLLVGGIVIMNIMLMVVSERTREIGLRKALGAKRRDIMSQVLTESITLSTFGGLVGILLGFTLAMLLAAVTPLPATLELWSILLGVGVTAAVGLFFGAYLPRAQHARPRSRRSDVNKGLLGEVLRMALETLRTNKMRSGLTVLGVVIGITSIVGMTSLIRGFDSSLRATSRNSAPARLPEQAEHRQHQRRRRVR